jgi:signal transduction histidine kinase
MATIETHETRPGHGGVLTSQLPYLRIAPVEGLLLIVLAVMVIATAVVGKRLERAVVADTLRKITGTTAVYVDDVLESVLKKSGSTETGYLSSDTIAELDRSLEQMTARADIVGLKIWNADGRVLYSEDPSLIGRFYPEVRGEPKDAWGGSVTWRVSTLEGAEHALLRQSWDKLLEVFTPIQVTDVPGVDAVVEFYYPLDSIDTVVAATKRSTWFFMIGIAFPVYLVLAVAIRRTSKTIWRQQDELRNQVVNLSALLDDNRALHDKLRAAAAHGTEMNELYRRRISSELHDGAVQHLGYALLRLDAVRECFVTRFGGASDESECAEQLDQIRHALRAGLAELRQLSSGLAGVQFEDASLGTVISTAVSQHIRRTRTAVALDARDLPKEVPLAVRIAAYRFVQESLNNSFQHGGAVSQHVTVVGNGDSVLVEVSDEGPGFDKEAALRRGECLGLRGLRDRITILGGSFDIDSGREIGTRLTARLPLHGVDEEAYAS